MTEALNKLETNPVNFLNLICRSENPRTNGNQRASALEVLDVQRGKLYAYSDLLPLSKQNLLESEILDRITSRRNLVSLRPPEIIASAVSTIEDRVKTLTSSSDIVEQLNSIDMSKMTYGEARAAIYDVLQKSNPNIASELFHEPPEAEGDRKWVLEAMREMTEASIASCYANSIIAQEIAKAKATSLTQTASIDSSKVTSLRVVDADSGSKIAPLTEVPSPSPERKTAASK